MDKETGKGIASGVGENHSTKVLVRPSLVRCRARVSEGHRRGWVAQSLAAPSEEQLAQS